MVPLEIQGGKVQILQESNSMEKSFLMLEMSR